MKKRYFGIALAALLMTQPLLALGASNSNPSTSTAPVITGGGSSRDHGSSGPKGSSRPLDTNASGPAMTGGNTGTAAVGVVVTEENTLAGQAVNVPHTETMSVGTVDVRFANDQEVKEKFPWYLAEKIFTINSGTTPLYRAIGTSNLVGYNPLIPVQTLVAEDAATKEQKTDTMNLTLHVPNLIEGLNDVQILYYNDETRQWEMTAPSAIDFATKQVSIHLKGGTPFTVVYKNK